MKKTRAVLAIVFGATTSVAVATGPGDAGNNVPQPTLTDVLARAGTYVAEFQRQLSGIVAEEQYVQMVRYPRGARSGSDNKRRLRSDLLLVRAGSASEWFQFRDVFDVDGEAVRDRNDRLVNLFVNPTITADDQIRGILAESARYNIGSLLRTVNVPVLPLRFMEPKNQSRFGFKRTSDGSPARITTEMPAPPGHFRITTEVWTIEFAERQGGTMIRTTAMRDLPARGRFWIEPATGRVLMSELILENNQVRCVIDVNYQSQPILGLLVPIEMRERYDHLRDRSVIDGFATYGQFRQFQVNVSERFLIKQE